MAVQVPITGPADVERRQAFFDARQGFLAPPHPLGAFAPPPANAPAPAVFGPLIDLTTPGASRFAPISIPGSSDGGGDAQAP